MFLMKPAQKMFPSLLQKMILSRYMKKLRETLSGDLV